MAIYESQIFGSYATPKSKYLTAYEINDHELVQSFSNFDIVCLFGTSILSNEWLDSFPDRIVNLHLGLSPYYKGSATLFWPFFNDELQYLGTTIHLASKAVDAGPILRRLQFRIPLNSNYYQITNKLIKHSIDQFPYVIEKYLSGDLIPVAQESCFTQRFYRKKDFNDHALQRVLHRYSLPIEPNIIDQIYQDSPCPD